MSEKEIECCQYSTKPHQFKAKIYQPNVHYQIVQTFTKNIKLDTFNTIN